MTVDVQSFTALVKQNPSKYGTSQETRKWNEELAVLQKIVDDSEANKFAAEALREQLAIQAHRIAELEFEVERLMRLLELQKPQSLDGATLDNGEASGLSDPVRSRFRRQSPLTREALKELLKSSDYDWSIDFPDDPYGARADAILSKFALPEPAEVQHLWDPEGNSMCGGGGTFDEAPDLGDRLIDIPVCAKCFVEIRREQRDSRWGSEPAEVEWGLSDSMLDSFPEPHFTTKSEENVRMNQRRGHPAIKVVSRTVTPWVLVEKGAESEDARRIDCPV